MKEKELKSCTALRVVLTVNGVLVLLVLPLVKEGFGREDNSAHTCHGNTSSEEQETFPSCEYSLERSDVILISRGPIYRAPISGGPD